MARRLSELPQEILLYIYAFLDLPDLAALAKSCRALASLTTDPILHKYRLTVAAPSRVNHSLFGTSPHGVAIRPTVGDLWRSGNYFYSRTSIMQYEMSLALFRNHVGHVLSLQLRRRLVEPHTTSMNHLLTSHVFPDTVASSLRIDRSLIPIVRRLKWAIQKDRFGQLIKKSLMGKKGETALKGWLEGPGRSVVGYENEKVRLAICPDIRRRIGFFERLESA
ncbi:hypothetical protein BKA70DRAFT_1251141 [Coprinopsis sp. MPI-PUGE-AT-0042]|nr:hypothetical protein BKA70DRAFT_1251141 [Coprinopsis sp. MPI-PUGE-AT-0042]